MIKLSKEEMIIIVQKLLNGEGSEEEEHQWMEKIEFSVPCPDISNLIYWPEEELSAKEIVEKALSYKIIQL
ncbi:hypothetical protein Q5741_00900 [Paenibacillus sp. JX-17]|uniref:E9imm peptide n=1 Tax=Paenibacillus lacisoli TaxID=3064525 RepID=A0ABT9C6S4_9BACL|nr:hypothetical protein [Paenibacillus sp. JX-17]MDO7904967.1 hypothetical protein [Paenibacillus sp. JX-17]